MSGTSGVEAVLKDLHRRWKWDADVMVCRECKRAIHVSRSMEALKHSDGCSNADSFNPWPQMFGAIASAPQGHAVQVIQEAN